MTTAVIIPDGGWGWVIVASSFLIHMFMVGTLYALSVLYVAWLEHFQNSKGVTSWIISLAVAVMFAIGPLPGSLTKRFGNRTVVILGGLITSLGFFSSFFAPNVYYLVVSIGLVTGVGAGCCFLPSVSLVALYFTSKRSMAMGIAASGLGVGVFFMAPFLNWLVDFYGWRGTMLILSGISLNMCVLGFLMRPIETAPKLNLRPACLGKRSSNHKTIDSENAANEDEKCPVNGDLGQYSVSSSKLEPPSILVDEYQKCPLPSDTAEPASLCVSQEMGKASERESHPTPKDTLTSSRYPQENQFHDSELELIRILDEGNIDDPPPYESTDSQSEYHQIVNRVTTTNTADVSEMNQKRPLLLSSEPKSFDSQSNTNGLSVLPHRRRAQLMQECRGGGSLQALPSALDVAPSPKPYSSSSELSRSVRFAGSADPPAMPLSALNDLQVMLAGSISSFIFVNSEFVSLLSVVSKPSLVTVHSDHGEEGKEPNVQILEDSALPGDVGKDGKEAEAKNYSPALVYFRLLKHGQFMWFCLSNFLTNMSFFMPVLYMVDRAVDNGIPKAQAAMLISLYGAGNIFGKLFLGWLADRGFVDRLFYYISCLGLCGVATCLSPMCGSHHWLHSIYGFCFGFFIGGYVTLFPIVTVDLLGLSDIGEAMGLLLAFMGVGIALGTPVAGWIFDWTGSYTMSFILHGAVIVFSALMLVPHLLLKHRHRLTAAIKSKKKAQHTATEGHEREV